MLKKGRSMSSSHAQGIAYWGLHPMGNILCKLALQRIAKGPDKLAAKLATHALKLNEEGDRNE